MTAEPYFPRNQQFGDVWRVLYSEKVWSEISKADGARRLKASVEVPVDLRLDNQELRCAEDIRAVVEAASMAVAPHTHFDLTPLYVWKLLMRSYQ